MAHPWLTKSREELLELFVIAQMNPQNPDSVALRTLLHHRIAEDQLRAAAENAKAGDQLANLTAALVTATRRLVQATVAVAIVTAVVAIVTAAPLFLKCAR